MAGSHLVVYSTQRGVITHSIVTLQHQVSWGDNGDVRDFNSHTLSQSDININDDIILT